MTSEVCFPERKNRSWDCDALGSSAPSCTYTAYNGCFEYDSWSHPLTISRNYLAYLKFILFNKRMLPEARYRSFDHELLAIYLASNCFFPESHPFNTQTDDNQLAFAFQWNHTA